MDATTREVLKAGIAMARDVADDIGTRGWPALARDMLEWVERARSVLAASPSPSPGEPRQRETFNANEYVWIQLNDKGRKVYRDYWNAIGLDPVRAPLPEDENGWFRFQLWEVMQIFGPTLSASMDVPFSMEMRLSAPAPSAESDLEALEVCIRQCDVQDPNPITVSDLCAYAREAVAELRRRRAGGGK